jgi:hypothetical protein
MRTEVKESKGVLDIVLRKKKKKIGLSGGSGSRFTFYWRFAGFVEEQLISQCDGDDSWWVPNIELSYCRPEQKVQCQVADLNRAKSKAAPVLVQGKKKTFFSLFLLLFLF